jgi:hypothetical protein
LGKGVTPDFCALAILGPRCGFWSASRNARPCKRWWNTPLRWRAACSRSKDLRGSGDDQDAKATVCDLIEQMGYAAVDLGGTANCAVTEAPRRPGAVYGEEYRLADAKLVVEAVRSGRPLPPTPDYQLTE